MRTITIREWILVKTENFMYENERFQGYFTEVSFGTSVGNQLSYFQNGYFSKNLWDVMSHKIKGEIRKL